MSEMKPTMCGGRRIPPTEPCDECDELAMQFEQSLIDATNAADEAKQAADNAGNSASVVNQFRNDVNVLKARVDELTSLPDGSTSGDAELIDIRVGADGVTYPTAGDAVRGQITDLKSDINDIAEPFIQCYAETTDFDFLTDKYYNNSATENDAEAGSNYHIAQPFRVPKGTYTLCEIVPFFCSYEVGGTFTRVGTETSRTTVTLTLTSDATLYLTTRTSNPSLQIGVVKGNSVPSTLEKGIFDFELNGVKYTELVSQSAESIQKTSVVHKCYANTNSFDFLTDKYYNANGTTANAYAGSNYHIASPISVNPGEYSFTGVVPSFSFIKLASQSTGTKLGDYTGVDGGVITKTINESATIYLTTKTSNTNLRILAVDGSFMPNTIVDVGLFDVAVGGASLQDLKEKSADSEYYENADNTTLSLYESVAVIGDSYSSGGLYGITGITAGRHNAISWLKILGRRCGFTANLYATPAYNTYDFLNDNTSDYGLTAMLNANPSQLYFIMLGINGDEDNTIGTIADCNVDWTQNGNSFYGRYGKIIGNIMNHAPKAKIVCIVPPQGTTRFAAIEDVAEFYGVPCMKTLDDVFFHSDFYTDNLSTGHPIAVTYAGMALAIERLYSHCVMDNVDYFKNYEGQ